MIDVPSVPRLLTAYTPPDEPEAGIRAVPPLREWPALIQRNAEAFRRVDFSLGSCSASELRRMARAELRVFAPARPTAVSCGGDEPVVVMAGHQNEFYHPGVWVKNHVLTRFCSETGAKGLNLWVDFDTPGRVGFTVPSRTPSLRKVALEWFNPGPYTPLEEIPAPSRESWTAVEARVLETLDGLPTELTRRFRAYSRKLGKARCGHDDFSSLMAFSRRACEIESGYEELAASAILDSPAFMEFFCSLAGRFEELHAVYNENLRQYRLIRGIRNAVNPLPDLGMRGDVREAPFWVVQDGLRFPLWIERRSDGLHLFAKDVPVGTLAPGKPLPRGAKIRPRALVFTLFVRLFLCDLFIHGTGGARYDIITDGIARDLFGVEPPAYAAVTATMYPFAHVAPRPDRRLAELRQRLRALEHNPQLLIDGSLADEGGGLREAAARKRALVEAMGGLSGAQKRDAATRIIEENRRMAALLAPMREETERSLEELLSGLGERRILAFREYPFFLFDSAALMALAESLPLP